MANNRKGKPSDSRAGQMKDRQQLVGTRTPDLGYYLIVTDTKETEKNYFEGLRDSIPEGLKNRLVIKVQKAKTTDLIKKVKEFLSSEAQYRIPWIVFDRDRVVNFDEIIGSAEKSRIHAGWSNPCFEIWMYAYLGEMPSIRESDTCCSHFSDRFERIAGQEYRKNDKDIYRKLLQCGNEEKAIQIARQRYKECINDGKNKPSEMCPASTVYELVEEIKGKSKNQI